MPYEGRGMLFPPSYYRDEFSPAEEAEQAREEQRVEAEDDLVCALGEACPCGGDWTLCEGCPDA